jgi:hypothetical protein
MEPDVEDGKLCTLFRTTSRLQPKAKSPVTSTVFALPAQIQWLFTAALSVDIPGYGATNTSSLASRPAATWTVGAPESLPSTASTWKHASSNARCNECPKPSEL